MKVTNVKLRNLEGNGKLKAIGSITFDDVFVVTDVGVVEGSKGLFVSMPSRKDAEGNYRNTAFPINQDFRAQITDEVMAVYERNMEDAGVLENEESVENEEEVDAID